MDLIYYQAHSQNPESDSAKRGTDFTWKRNFHAIAGWSQIWPTYLTSSLTYEWAVNPLSSIHYDPDYNLTRRTDFPTGCTEIGQILCNDIINERRKIDFYQLGITAHNLI